MSKFSVGDRVVVVENNHSEKDTFLQGRGAVLSVSDSDEYDVTVDLGFDRHVNFDSSELEFEHIYDALSAKPDAAATIFNEADFLAIKVDSRPGDVVNHPSHYTSHPSGIECIQVTEHMNFNLGNATKYVWRAGLKSDDPVQDLQKARWYIEREIQRLGGTVG
jgi:hypothetical protein